MSQSYSSRRMPWVLGVLGGVRERVEAHLDDSQVTYEEHLGFAVKASFRLAYASFASMIHAFVPAAFPATAARIVIELYKERLEFHPNPRYQEMMHGKSEDLVDGLEQAAQ